MPVLRNPGPLVAAVLGLLVAGCASGGGNQTPCPSARVLADPSELTRFGDGAGRDPTDIAFEASFLRVTGKCRYDKDGGEIEVDLVVTLEARQGAADAGNEARFGYFVALAYEDSAAGSEPVILKREAVPVDVIFKPGRLGLVHTDNLELAIPRENAQDVRNYRLYLGFELTPEELAFNRRKFGR